MRFRKFHAAAIALVASTAFLSQAQADQLHVGSPAGPTINITASGALGTILGTSPRNENGGDFTNSALNGNSLPWTFCVDLTHTVIPGGNYNNTVVTNDGTVNGATVGGSDAAADQIAYLLLKYGTSSLNTPLEGELQAAIWKIEYDGQITINSVSGGSLSNVAALITEAQTNYQGGERTQLAWLSPHQNADHSDIHQGLVTITSPEPSTFAIAALAGLGMLSYGRRRRGR